MISSLIVSDGMSLILLSVFVITIARKFGTELVGQYSFAQTIYIIVQLIADAGLDITLPRSVAQNPENAATLLYQALRAKFLLICILVPISIVMSFLSGTQNIAFVIIILLGIYPRLLVFTVASTLRGLHVVAKSEIIIGIYTLLAVIVATLILFLGQYVWISLLVFLLFECLKSIHIWHYAKTIIPQQLSVSAIFKDIAISNLFNSTKQLLFEQRFMLLTNILSGILTRIPILMIGFVGTDSMNGIYSSASRFTNSLRIIPGAIFNSLLPFTPQTSIDLDKQTEAQPISLPSKTKNTVIIGGLCISLLISTILILFSDTIIYYTFRFPESATVLRILAVGFFGVSMKSIAEALLFIEFKEKFIQRVVLIVTLCTVGGVFIATTYSVRHIAWVVSSAELILALIFIITLYIQRPKLH